MNAEYLHLEQLMEKKIEENLHLKLKLASTEIDLERTKHELFVREAEASKTKLETLQKRLQGLVDEIKNGLDEQGFELTGINLESGTVQLQEKLKETSESKSNETD